MRKSLLLVLALLSITPFGLRAQESLFELESDTVCVGQEVRIRPSAMNASSYYWGFCSGYLKNTPLMDNIGSTFQFNDPSSIELGKSGDNYYGFVVNRGNGDLLRLDFGKSMSNIPTVTNFGNLDLTVPPSPNSMYLLQDSGKWFLFITGGGVPAVPPAPAIPSSLSRIDFGNNLGNVPNGVRMGNPNNLLNNPRGIFVSRQGPVYYGFVVNYNNNQLVRLNFGSNISRTPTANVVTATTQGSTSVLGQPNDIAPVFEAGSWYFFVPNGDSNYITRYFFGSSLSNNPVRSRVTPYPSTILNNPTSISLIKECGGFYAYVTNKDNEEVLRYPFNTLNDTGLVPDISLSPTGLWAGPTDMSRVMRDRDSLFSFVLNATTNSLVRFTFPQCQDASIQSSTLPTPPAIRYTAAGDYNIYLAVNEGQPNMAIDCKQVRVIEVPPITLTPDTLICQGDTLRLVVASQFATNYFFSPNFRLSDTAGINIYVYPDRPFTYNIGIPFPNGCFVDTTIRVDVSRVLADAGPDRTIHDGARTVLGSPNTYQGPQYTYEWFPTQFMDNPFSLTPTVSPSSDLTYYLRVTNTNKCVDIDTVNVKVSCGDIYLPNAFAPNNGRGAPTHFGLLNNAELLVQLNYFRIFDRWGREVFTTTDVTKEWDGNVGGKPAPLGVYVWAADGFCAAGQRISRSGNVTLIR